MKVETTFQLYKVIEDGEVFKPLKSVNQIPGKFLSFEYFQDTDDGTFLRVSDYTRLVNRMENYGTAEYLTWAGSRKLQFDTGYCQVIRESKYSTKATLLFPRPIQMILDYVNDQPILTEVDRIEGEFTHEWGWLKKGRQDKLANAVEIYFDCQQLYNTKIA
jgi:hypothetical protein